MSKVTKKGFLNSISFPNLFNRVIRQSGGWELFKENAPDIYKHGIGGGFHGWIYYKETVPFAKANLKDILLLATNISNDLDIDVFEMISKFGCNKDFSLEEVFKVLTRIETESEDYILNCLAWFACEEAAISYMNFLDSSKYS